MVMVLTTDRRLAEIEHRLDLMQQSRDGRRGELMTVRSELGTEVADLRGVLTELQGKVGEGDADLRSGLDTLGERVGRIERIAEQWESRTYIGARGGGGPARLPVPGPRGAVPEFDGGADEQTPIW